MLSHLRYARYLLRHKLFVLVAGLRIGPASRWGWPAWLLRLLVHDWSKLLPSEWRPYARHFYGRPPALNPMYFGHAARGQAVEEWRAETAAAFDRAWLLHQHRQPHHFQHWILRQDDGATKILPMPEVYAREMVADWMGAGRAITGRWEAVAWYAANQPWISLHPDTREYVEALLGIMPRLVHDARNA